MTTTPDGVKVARMALRGTKTLKHYKANILTQASPADQDTLTTLLSDLRHTAQKSGLSFEDSVKLSLDNYLAEA